MLEVIQWLLLLLLCFNFSDHRAAGVFAEDDTATAPIPVAVKLSEGVLQGAAALFSLCVRASWQQSSFTPVVLCSSEE